MKPLSLAVLSLTTLLFTACSPEPTPTPTPKTPPTQPQPSPEVKAPTTAPAVMPDEPVKPANVAAPALADLGKLLSTVKDAPTAEAAKPQLEALTQQLQTAKKSVSGGTKDALGGLGKLATDAAGKLGVSSEVMTQIKTLLQDPAIAGVIGPVLQKLQGLLQ